MDYWVGVTNPNWFEFLSTHAIDSEVNFWQPSPTPPTRKLQEGMPFLFKLKSPYNDIAGGGYFVSFSTMPIWLAWEIFDKANGFASFDKMLQAFATSLGELDANQEIGCTTLAAPFYLPKDRWLNVNSRWPQSIQRGKGFDLATVEGRGLWDGITEMSGLSEAIPSSFGYAVQGLPLDAGTRSAWVRQRIGQRGFRVLVTSAYRGRCAITGENTLDVLEAAHIRPFSERQDHDVRNGLLLRADFHRLYDRGLVSITPDLLVRVSPRIRERYVNGKAYYRLDGKPLKILPEDPNSRPDLSRLEWHFEHRFQTA